MSRKDRAIRSAVDGVTRAAADGGSLIELGWAAHCAVFPISVQCQPMMMQQLKTAYYAGAQHLYASIMGAALDPGRDETDGDLRRMAEIDAELNRWAAQMGETFKPAKGRA